MKKILKKVIVKKGESKKIADVWVFDKPGQKQEIEVRAVVEAGGSLELRGMIKIKKEAVGSDVFLTQKVLLVGDGARAVTVPELEIECNQVKASHASSVGQMDVEQVYYLRSRGITESEAKKMLVKAFMSDL